MVTGHEPGVRLGAKGRTGSSPPHPGPARAARAALSCHRYTTADSFFISAPLRGAPLTRSLRNVSPASQEAAAHGHAGWGERAALGATAPPTLAMLVQAEAGGDQLCSHRGPGRLWTSS